MKKLISLLLVLTMCLGLFAACGTPESSDGDATKDASEETTAPAGEAALDLSGKFSIGYGKTAKFIDAMEEIGIVSGPNGTKPREVLMTREEWENKLKIVLAD